LTLFTLDVFPLHVRTVHKNWFTCLREAVFEYSHQSHAAQTRLDLERLGEWVFTAGLFTVG